MDWSTFIELLGYLLAPITGVVSWFAGKRSRNNSTLNELQSTIDMLVDKNAELIKKVVALSEENAELKAGQAAMLEQIKTLQAKVEGAAE